jgi:hypothetical protein
LLTAWCWKGIVGREQEIDVGPAHAFAVEQLELESVLETESQAFVEAHEHGLGSVLPWRAISAATFSSRKTLVEGLRTLPSSSDSQQAIEAMKKRAVSSGSEVLKNAISDRWASVIYAGEQMLRKFDALTSVIAAQMWHTSHGYYPSTPEPQIIQKDSSKIRYQTSRDGRELSIAIYDGADWQTLFATNSIGSHRGTTH